MLGLGDIAIPAFFVSLMHDFDLHLAALAPPPPPKSAAAPPPPAAPLPPYGRNAVLAYSLGIAAAFYANGYVRRGQPALLYLVPAVLGAALLTAWSRGEVEALVAFEAELSDSQIPLDMAMLSEEKRRPSR